MNLLQKEQILSIELNSIDIGGKNGNDRVASLIYILVFSGKINKTIKQSILTINLIVKSLLICGRQHFQKFSEKSVPMHAEPCLKFSGHFIISLKTLSLYDPIKY